MSTTPEGFVIERCRTETCQAPIVWARTKTGKSMPVDAEPSADGNVRLYARQGIVRADVVTPDDTGDLRTSHFVTCSRAAEWRQR